MSYKYYHRRSTTGPIFIYFFFYHYFIYQFIIIIIIIIILHFHPFGDPYDTFMRLLCPENFFSIDTQSTFVYGLLYTCRQGRKHGVLVLFGSWDSPHRKLILHPLPLFHCWLSTHESLCKRSHQLPSSKISISARKN